MTLHLIEPPPLAHVGTIDGAVVINRGDGIGAIMPAVEIFICPTCGDVATVEPGDVQRCEAGHECVT